MNIPKLVTAPIISALLCSSIGELTINPSTAFAKSITGNSTNIANSKLFEENYYPQENIVTPTRVNHKFLIIARGKKVNVIFKKGALKDIRSRKPDLNTKSKVRQEVVDAVRLAEQIASAGVKRLDYILAPRRRRNKKKRWRNDKIATTYFGRRQATVPQIKAVRRRLKRAHRRLANRKLNIRLLPQSRASKSSTNGHNRGGPITPLRFVLFPNWFIEKSKEEKAAIIIHELLHDWFVDHKIRDGGKRKTVYGSYLAKKLARKRPRAARRNPENYEQFTLEAWRSVRSRAK